MDAVLAVCDIALVTLDDEIALGACTDAASCAARLAALGVSELVVKDGADGAWVLDAGRLQRVPAAAVVPVDTTAAGDSFNGAYLAARLRGLSRTEAAILGNTVAGRVVQHPGAIIATAEMPGLAS
jgi:2-dehydro-3-deoxygluconokinase